MSKQTAEQIFDEWAYSRRGEDIRRGFVRWVVYKHLIYAPVLNYAKAVEVKVSALAVTLRLSRRNVIEALDWLVAEGYLIQEGRGSRRVRALRLEYILQPTQAA